MTDITDAVEGIHTFDEDDAPLFHGYGFAEEWAVEVHSVICDEVGPDERRCTIHGIPRGDVRPDRPLDMTARDIGAVYVQESVMPEESWQTMGETGLIWVQRGESRFGRDLPECEVRSDPHEPDDILVCHE